MSTTATAACARRRTARESSPGRNFRPSTCPGMRRSPRGTAPATSPSGASARPAAPPLTFRRVGGDATDIALATLDEADAFMPEDELWTESQRAWVPVNENLPRHPRDRTWSPTPALNASTSYRHEIIDVSVAIDGRVKVLTDAQSALWNASNRLWRAEDTAASGKRKSAATRALRRAKNLLEDCAIEQDGRAASQPLCTA